MIPTTILILLAISAICAWGSFSQAFHDNMWQRLGMITTLFGCLSMVGFVWRLDYIPAAALTMLVGVLFFAIGTAIKTYNRCKRSRKVARYGRIYH